MSKFVINLLLFLTITPGVLLIFAIIGLNEYPGWAFFIGISLTCYIIFFKNKKGRGNPIKTEPNPNAQPYFAVIDVETTGLIKYDATPTKKLLEEEPDNFPKIVQIAWITLSKKYEIVEQKSYYIKQNSPIPKESQEIHKITDEICQDKGRDLHEVLMEFNNAMKPCDYFVGHNVMFDKRVIEAEFIRSRIAKPFKYMKKYDTMSMGRELMERRWFKLEELALYMFGKKQMEEYNLHNAEDDVAITSVCFAWLHKKGFKF